MIAAILLAATVRVTAGAELSIPEGQIGFRTTVFFRDWFGRAAVGDHACEADGSRAFTVPCDHVKARPLTGTARFTHADGAVRAVYEVRAQEPVDAYYVAHVGIGSMDAYAGGALVRDGEVVSIPKTFDPAQSGWEKDVRTLTFRTVAGKDVFSLRFDEPVRVSVHDGRKWNWDVLQVRVLYSPHGKLDANARRRLAFAVTSPAALSLENEGPWTVTAGADWVPVDFRPGVEKGSALDFSGMRPNPDVPAGALGRVIVRGEQFEFADKPGVPQRFYGINVCGDTCCPDPREVPALVDEWARIGYNAVRFHHHENALVKPGTPELDPEKMRRFDTLVAACIARGIYMATDLFVSRMVPAAALGLAGGGLVPMDEFKHLVFFHEGAYSNFLAYANHFLSHRNGVTGRTLAEEPALAWLSFVNEGTLGNLGMEVFRKYPVIRERWRAWLDEKRRTDPRYAEVGDDIPADLLGKTRASQAFVVFLADAERRFAVRTTAFLRERLKCRALTTNMNSWTYPAAYQVPRGEEYDFVDDHGYVDHPRFPAGYGRLPSELDNGNPVRSGGRGMFGFASRRIFGKPFTVSEFNFCGPSAWRGTSGLLTGAQAALQGWAGLWRFDWADRASVLTNRASRGASCYFDISGDPLNLAAERAAVALFLRGDLAPLRDENPLVLGREALVSPSDAVASSVTGQALPTGWARRLGTRVTTGLGRTDPAVFGQANAGAVNLRVLDGFWSVRTARTCGFVAEGGMCESGALTADLERTPATVWVSALDGRPIGQAMRLIVAHLTDCQDTGLTYADRSRRNLLLAGGRMPRLMRVGHAEIAVAVAPGRYCVYALASDGTRRMCLFSGEVKDAVRFGARTDLLPGACWLYEIVRMANGTTVCYTGEKHETGCPGRR